MIENRLAEYAKALDMSVKMTSNHAARSLFALTEAVAEFSEGGRALATGGTRITFESIFPNAGVIPTAKKLNSILSKLREVNEELVEVEKITRDMVERATGK